MPHIVGYAPGVFDLFHIGHLNILRHARARCDYLVAGVTSDETVTRKGYKAVVPLVERLEIVRSIRFVDAAIVETEPDDRLVAWEQVRFNVLFKGDDWRGTARAAKLEADCAKVGAEVVYFPYTVHTSSSQLRRALETLAPAVTPERSPAAPDAISS